MNTTTPDGDPATEPTNRGCPMLDQTAETTTDIPTGRNYELGQVVGYVDLIDRDRSKQAEFQITETSRWFCLVTAPNCQSRVALGLYELGYRTFYPKVKKWASHARVRKAVERPLLGRYLFVEVDPENDQHSFFAVRNVNGAQSVLSTMQASPFGMGMQPVAFPSPWIDSLRERQMAGEWDEVAKGPLPIGARIRVVEGEFNDMLATVTARKGRRIDFKLFGENRYGRMNECSVRAA